MLWKSAGVKLFIGPPARTRRKRVVFSQMEMRLIKFLDPDYEQGVALSYTFHARRRLWRDYLSETKDTGRANAFVAN